MVIYEPQQLGPFSETQRGKGVRKYIMGRVDSLEYLIKWFGLKTEGPVYNASFQIRM
jgi:hypothetical protein